MHRTLTPKLGLNLPRVPLVLSPTPLHRLDRLSEELGLDLWIKRDDLTGFAFGGNKGRKLEYLVGEALASGADTVLTCGSAQSNFIRQLATACAMFGLKCVAVVMQLPYEYAPARGAMRTDGGNLLLDQLVGCEVRLIANGTWDELFAAADLAEVELRNSGRTVFKIPVGGSTPQGAYAFAQAAMELSAQTAPFDAIVCASSSGSTQTGLAYAYAGTSTRVIGVACDPEPELTQEFADLAAKLDELTGMGVGLQRKDFIFDLRFVGEGYGVPSEAGMAAIHELAQKEGVFLDPIYSSKAFSGLLSMARSGELTGRVCFWHTGGLPALFALP